MRYTEKMVSAHAHRVTCTWWLLWLAVEMPWLALGGPILALVTPLSPYRGSISGSEGNSGSERFLLAENAD